MSNLFLFTYYQKMRISFYSMLSDEISSGKPTKMQPVLIVGSGKVIFGDQVGLGFWPSPFYFNGYAHLEARNKTALIKFGDNVKCNNNIVIVCEGSTIEIGDNVLIGTNVEIYDSDFHGINPGQRLVGNHIHKQVFIGNNVFIGSNVKILKGTSIGSNSVVANSAVVLGCFPENVLIGGNPAKVISSIDG